MRTQQLYIDGTWQDGVDVRTVRSPWDGRQVGTSAIAEVDQIQAAVDSADRALRDPLPAHRRAAILSAAADLATEHAEELAVCISEEAGKPITAARGEVSRALDTLRFSAEEARRLPGETVPFDAVPAGEGKLAFTIAEPVGIVAAITPFNFPLNLVAHKVGPAVAAGCPVLLKPSERTPLTAGLLTELFADAGLPPGHLNLVTGEPSEIVPAWLSDDRVAALTFTGSSAVGWKLKEASPRKLHTLELGSATAMVVADDGDVTRAAAAATAGGFGFSGQACISLQRVYVHRDVADEFTTQLAKAADALVGGNPSDEQTDVGPLITAEAADRVESWIAEAVGEGAQVVAGGTREGSVVRPTVVRDVPPNAALVCSEVFGPVVSVVTVDDLDEAISLVNAPDYGLNTAIFTSDVAAALTYARRAEAGTVLLNTTPTLRTDHMPYGGVKDSGQGREGVRYATEEFLHQKLIVLAP